MGMSAKLFGAVLAGLLLLPQYLPAQEAASASTAPGALVSAPAGASTTTATPVLRSAYGQRLQLAGLRNGGKISESLFRGAQPQSDGLQALKKLGVTTIVDLRGEDRSKLEWERHQAEALGMRFVSIPVSGWGPPSNEQVLQFLSLFEESAKDEKTKEKVYVHCRFGEDRTGVFVATYRMALEGWPAQQAMNEMYFFGFNGFWHPSMKNFIRDFPARLKMSPEFAQFRPAPGTVEAAK